MGFLPVVIMNGLKYALYFFGMIALIIILLVVFIIRVRKDCNE